MLKSIIESSIDNKRKITEGKIVCIKPPVLIAKMPEAVINSECEVNKLDGNVLHCRVVGVQNSDVVLASYDEIKDLKIGALVRSSGKNREILIGENLFGRVLNAFGGVVFNLNINDSIRHINSHGETRKLFSNVPLLIDRRRVSRQFITGVNILDNLIPIGEGQRVAVLGEAGTGKSTFLADIIKNSSADLKVVCLVGERGREANEFIDEILAKSTDNIILVVSTSDENPLRRYLAPYTATTIAEYFRDQGKNVLLIVDSITRMARALREIAVSSGEIPIRGGFPSSLYSELPKLFERAGRTKMGIITAFYSLLIEDEKNLDPLSEEIKSLLDGHIILSKRWSDKGLWPAIDPLRSLSRLKTQIVDSNKLKWTSEILIELSYLDQNREWLLLGGEKDERLQKAIEIERNLIKGIFRNIM